MKNIAILFASLFTICFTANARITYELSEKGALAKVRLKVVDQDGVVVPSAKIWGGFTCGNRLDDYVLVDGVTSTNGEYIVQGKCNEFLRVDVIKEGYYQTEEKIYFARSKADPIVVDGKWQPYGETRRVVLNKIKNPYAVMALNEKQCHHRIPVFGQWLAFDMELSDWLSPYGKGVHDDVLLRFRKKLTDKWCDFAFSMEACFTNNPYAGIYIKQLNDYSDLKTEYFADTNAAYCTHYTFSLDSVSKKQSGLDESSYLVFRTRTRVDDKGKLVGAHYGKYCRGWRSNEKEMYFGSACFNPVENDVNIEGDQTLLYKVRNYKKEK